VAPCQLPIAQMVQDIQTLIPQIMASIMPMLGQLQGSFFPSSSSSSSSSPPPPNPFADLLNQFMAAGSPVLELLKEFTQGTSCCNWNNPDFISNILKNAKQSDISSMVNSFKQLKEMLNIDIDISSILEHMHRLALGLFDEKKFEEARSILTFLSEMEPKNMYYVYNLACAESLLNNKERAIALLRSAVSDCGYSNFDHLERDPDFDNIRSSPEFRGLIASLKPVKSEKTCSFSEPIIYSPAPVPVKAPAEPVKAPAEPDKAPAPPVPAPVPAPAPAPAPAPIRLEKPKRFQAELKQLKEMGFLDEDRVYAALLTEDGDLSRTIAVLLQ